MLILQSLVNFEPQGYQNKGILAKIDKFCLILQYEIMIYCKNLIEFLRFATLKHEEGLKLYHFLRKLCDHTRSYCKIRSILSLRDTKIKEY